MAMVFDRELKDPKTVGQLQELLQDLPPDTEVLSLTGPPRIYLAVWRDEETGVRRLNVEMET